MSLKFRHHTLKLNIERDSDAGITRDITHDDLSLDFCALEVYQWIIHGTDAFHGGTILHLSTFNPKYYCQIRGQGWLQWFIVLKSNLSR